MSLGIALADLGRYDEAVELLRENLEIRRRLQGDHHPNTIVNTANLGNALWAAGNPDAARPLLVAAAEASTVHLGPESHAAIFAVSSLAMFDRVQAPDPSSLPPLRDITALTPEVTGRSFFAAMRLQEELAGFCVDLGRTEEARRNYAELLATRREVAMQQDSGPAPRSEYAWLLMTCRLAEFRDAEAAMMFAREACELTAYRDPVYLDTLAFALALNGQAVRARELQDKALSLLPDGDDRRREEMRARWAAYDEAVRDGTSSVSLDRAAQIAKSAYLYGCHY
jgi:tetratricopeptide (TPR) repeat protein